LLIIVCFDASFAVLNEAAPPIFAAPAPRHAAAAAISPYAHAEFFAVRFAARQTAAPPLSLFSRLFSSLRYFQLRAFRRAFCVLSRRFHDDCLMRRRFACAPLIFMPTISFIRRLPPRHFDTPGAPPDAAGAPFYFHFRAAICAIFFDAISRHAAAATPILFFAAPPRLTRLSPFFAIAAIITLIADRAPRPDHRSPPLPGAARLPPARHPGTCRYQPARQIRRQVATRHHAWSDSEWVSIEWRRFFAAALPGRAVEFSPPPAQDRSRRCRRRH
jgi:hypothetical protein